MKLRRTKQRNASSANSFHIDRLAFKTVVGLIRERARGSMEEEKDSSKAMHNLVLRSQSLEKVSIGWRGV